MGVLLNNETVKEIANIGAGFNNINDTSNKKEATVFVVLDMHPGLMDPTETLGKYKLQGFFDDKFHIWAMFKIAIMFNDMCTE